MSIMLRFFILYFSRAESEHLLDNPLINLNKYNRLQRWGEDLDNSKDNENENISRSCSQNEGIKISIRFFQNWILLEKFFHNSSYVEQKNYRQKFQSRENMIVSLGATCIFFVYNIFKNSINFNAGHFLKILF